MESEINGLKMDGSSSLYGLVSSSCRHINKKRNISWPVSGSVRNCYVALLFKILEAREQQLASFSREVSCGYQKKISGSVLPTAFRYHYNNFLFKRVCLFVQLKQTANCRRVQSPSASANLDEAQNIYNLESRRLT
jgi:hypothetical protein